MTQEAKVQLNHYQIKVNLLPRASCKTTDFALEGRRAIQLCHGDPCRVVAVAIGQENYSW